MRSSCSVVCYGGPITRQFPLDWRAAKLFVWLDIRPDCLVRGDAHATVAVQRRRFILGPRRGVGVSCSLSP
eukprot:14044405-Heterocapsa_arctica.AAC.1